MATLTRFMEDNHVLGLVVPVADFIATGKTTDEVCMKRWDHATFLVITGANASADEPKFVVESCSDTSGSNNTAIGFDYTSTDGETLQIVTIGRLTAERPPPVIKRIRQARST